KEENNIIEFYRDKGYADVEIKSLVEKDETQKKVIISFQISEGPHYEIKFDGNKEFLDMTLKKELKLFRKGNKADLNLRRSLKNLKKLYKKAGYLEIDINTKNEIVDEKGKRIRRITFLINEGIRSITESVSLSGNDSLKAKRIQENILTNPPGWIADGEFVPDVLEADKEAIKGLYMKNGFPETAVDSEIKWNKNTEKNQNMAQVNLKIHEGIQIRLETLSFDGLKSVTETEALMVLKLKPGLPFVEEQINADTTSLQALISEKGYPYVQVKPQVKISRHGNRVDVIYQVDEGPFVRMGQVYINGNFRTRQKVFLNELKVETGTPFSLKNILEAQRNIRDIMALDTANFKMLGLEEKADEVDMLISVEEKKTLLFSIGLRL
ncbi:hypothetical protein KKB18_10130, partial [bacterium]|nr:hypothetical protein [bacterium]